MDLSFALPIAPRRYFRGFHLSLVANLYSVTHLPSHEISFLVPLLLSQVSTAGNIHKKFRAFVWVIASGTWNSLLYSKAFIFTFLIQ